MLKAIQLWNQIQTWVIIQDKVKLVEPAVKEDKMNKTTKKNMMMSITMKKKMKMEMKLLIHNF